MTLAEIIKKLGEDLGLSKNDTILLHDEFVEILTENLEQDISFNLPGLGTFRTNVRDSYQSYSPKHKTMVKNPPKRVVQFLPDSSLNRELK